MASQKVLQVLYCNLASNTVCTAQTHNMKLIYRLREEKQ